MPRGRKRGDGKTPPETEAEAAERALRVVDPTERPPAERERRSLSVLGSLIREASEDLLASHINTLSIGSNVGDYLIEAKAQTERGQWLAFLADETPYSSRHAERLMYLARNRNKLAQLRPADTSLRGAVAALQAMNRQPKTEDLPPVSGNGKPEVELPDEFYAFDQIEDAADLPLPDGLIDLAVFSPPYGLGIDYDLTSDDHGYETYLGFVRDWVKELRRVMRHPSQDDPSGGRVAVNIPLDTRWAPSIPKLSGDPHAFYHDWLAILLGDPSEDGQPEDWRLNYRFSIIWAKVDDKPFHVERTEFAQASPGAGPVDAQCPICAAMPGDECIFEVEQIDGQPSSHRARGSIDSPTSPYVVTGVEMIVVVHAGQWKIKDLGTSDLGHAEWLRDTDGVWKVPAAPPVLRAEHPAPFHPEIPRRLIQLLTFPGQIVLDPFAGRGTTIEVAVETGRRCYAFDRSPKYVNTGRYNVEQALKLKYGSADKLVTASDLHPNLGKKRNGRPRIIDVPLPAVTLSPAEREDVTNPVADPEYVRNMVVDDSVASTGNPSDSFGLADVQRTREERLAELDARSEALDAKFDTARPANGSQGSDGSAPAASGGERNPFEHELEGDEDADDVPDFEDTAAEVDQTGVDSPAGAGDLVDTDREQPYETSDVRDRELDGSTVSIDELVQSGATVVSGMVYQNGMPTHVIREDGLAVPIPNVSVDLGALKAARPAPDPDGLPSGATGAGDWRDAPDDPTLRERVVEYGEGIRSVETRRGAPPLISDEERGTAVALAESPIRTGRSSVYTEAEESSEPELNGNGERSNDRHAKCPHGKRKYRCAECKANGNA